MIKSATSAIKAWLKWSFFTLSFLLLLALLYRGYLQYFQPLPNEVPFNCEICLAAPASCNFRHRQGVSLTGALVASNAINLLYNTPLNNEPHRFGNKLYVWKGRYVDPDQPPIDTVNLSHDHRTGSYALNKFTLKVGEDYMIGYAVGPSTKSIAATLQIPWNHQAFEPGKPSFTQVEPISIYQDHIVVKYRTPIGINPLANRHWVGIQQGKNATYERNRFQQHALSSPDHQGQLAINDYHILPDKWYTIVYGIGAGKQGIAASWTFHGCEAYGVYCHGCHGSAIPRSLPRAHLPFISSSIQP